MKDMKAILREAYAHPDRKAFYYSAGGEQTASARLNALPRWDWTPAITRYVEGSSTALFPIALGCPPKLINQEKEWFDPIIHSAAEAAKFVLPDVRRGRTGEILANIAKLRQTLPAGELIRNPDIQSPLGIAELIWDGSFYIAMLEEPEAVHRLLDQITEFVIAFIREAARIAGDRYNPCGFPGVWAEGLGTMVADDTMSLISPEMHREFSIPYVNRIAEQGGPLYYHSCTWRKPYYENIHLIKKAIAYNWNPGNSADPAELLGEFSGRAVLALHLAQNMHADPDTVKLNRNFADEADFLEYILDSMRDNTTIYCWFSNVIQKQAVIEKIYDLLDERGYTPQAQGVGAK